MCAGRKAGRSESISRGRCDLASIVAKTMAIAGLVLLVGRIWKRVPSLVKKDCKIRNLLSFGVKLRYVCMQPGSGFSRSQM